MLDLRYKGFYTIIHRLLVVVKFIFVSCLCVGGQSNESKQEKELEMRVKNNHPYDLILLLY